MNAPFIPRTSFRLVPPGRHERSGRSAGSHGKRKPLDIERAKELMDRWGIPIPDPVPQKHWNATRLAKAGFRKVRSIENGKRITRVIPIEG